MSACHPFRTFRECLLSTHCGHTPEGIRQPFSSLALRFRSATRHWVKWVGMTLKPLLAVVIAAVTASVPISVAAIPPAHVWEIGPWVRGRNYSVGMPASPDPGPDGAVIFEFPRAGHGQVDAMTTAVGPLAGARQITLRYRIDAARGAGFVANESPGMPATVSLYFQRRGDNWSAKGRYASYRWYAPNRAVVPLAPGVHTMTVRLDEPWINVNGVQNAEDPRGFADALQDTARLGLAFGSAELRSHGVYATGSARFTLLSLDIS